MNTSLTVAMRVIPMDRKADWAMERMFHPVSTLQVGEEARAKVATLAPIVTRVTLDMVPLAATIMALLVAVVTGVVVGPTQPQVEEAQAMQ